MPGWVTPQHPLMSVGSGVNHIRVECSIHQKVTELNFGPDSIAEFWACLCGTPAPAGLDGELGVVTGTHLAFMGAGTGRRLGGARLLHLLAHTNVGTRNRPCQAGLMYP